MPASVIIVGGAMAGATLAIALDTLCQGQVHIDIIEAQAPETMSGSGFDARSIALAHGTCRQLAAIGLWPALQAQAEPITQIHVSDRGHAGMVELHANEYGLDALGHVVGLTGVGEVLLQQLHQRPAIHWHCPDSVEHIQRTPEQVTVTLHSGRTLTAQLLVAADGTHSTVLQACQAKTQHQPYDQVAIIANVQTDLPHQGRAFERFTPHGPLALLPVNLAAGRGHTCSLVWCHPLAAQSSVLGWSEREFIHQLQQAFGWRLGRVTHVSPRSAYPLSLRYPTQHIHHRVAIVGNAAQMLHPIAGQGFNLGLRDVMTLAHTLADALENGKTDLGSYPVLSTYQQQRRQDQHNTIAVTDGLLHLFANSHLPLVAGRNLGLMAMQHCTPWRESLARKMLG
ncbi:MAG: 2-octaprenyl-6-methoxyphenyl hydroxylase [Plesiomonas sp.]